jgi:hypothetical protein
VSPPQFLWGKADPPRARLEPASAPPLLPVPFFTSHPRTRLEPASSPPRARHSFYVTFSDPPRARPIFYATSADPPRAGLKPAQFSTSHRQTRPGPASSPPHFYVTWHIHLGPAMAAPQLLRDIGRPASDPPPARSKPAAHLHVQDQRPTCMCKHNEQTLLVAQAHSTVIKLKVCLGHSLLLPNACLGHVHGHKAQAGSCRRPASTRHGAGC